MFSSTVGRAALGRGVRDKETCASNLGVIGSGCLSDNAKDIMSVTILLANGVAFIFGLARVYGCICRQHH